MIRRIQSLALAAFIGLVATFAVGIDPGQATVIYTASGGGLSASAEFDLIGSTLTVKLINTSLADVLVPTDVLTGLFFNTTHSLTPVSASLNGSSVFYGATSSPGDGWQFKSGVSAQGKNSGISAAGLGIFGPDGNFSGTPLNLNGLNFGLLSAGDDSATGNGGVTGGGPLIKNSVVFNLTADALFSLSELGSSVVFQYGTATTEPTLTGTLSEELPRVPEPASLLLLGVGLLGMMGIGWHRRRNLK